MDVDMHRLIFLKRLLIIESKYSKQCLRFYRSKRKTHRLKNGMNRVNWEEGLIWCQQFIEHFHRINPWLMIGNAGLYTAISEFHFKNVNKDTKLCLKIPQIKRWRKEEQQSFCSRLIQQCRSSILVMEKNNRWLIYTMFMWETSSPKKQKRAYVTVR